MDYIHKAESGAQGQEDKGLTLIDADRTDIKAILWEHVVAVQLYS
jgi:hypothetical protein